MLHDDIVLTFQTLSEAEDVLDCFIETASIYGDLHLDEVYDVCNKPLPDGIGEEAKSGWNYTTIESVEILKGHDGYLICMPPKDINIKEDKNMANHFTTTKTGDIPRVSSLEFEDPIEVEFEKKKKDLVDEAEKKILDIRQELAAALDKLRSEQYERHQQEKEKSMANMWKRKYDALVEAGFTEDQAWQMTMESFKLD